jgi:hypothetical protein
VTVTNSELLTGNHPAEMLTEIQRQTHYVLRAAVMRNPCPVCLTPSNLFEASGLDPDAYPIGSGVEPDYHCPRCHCKLRQTVPFFPQGQGGWFWRIDPAEAERIAALLAERRHEKGADNA